MVESKLVTAEDLENISAQLKQLDTVDAEIGLAVRAGIDVTDAKEQSQKARADLLRLKQTYGVNRL